MNWHTYLNELPQNPVGDVKPARWVTLEEAHFLYFVLRLHRPDILYEAGTANGFSTCWAALAMEENGGGMIYTYDPVNRAKTWDQMTDFVPKRRIAYREEPFLASLPEDDPGCLTAFFVDGDHSRGAFQEDIARVNKIARPGDLVILHDITGYRWISKYFDRESKDRESMLVRSARGIGYYVV